MGWLIPGDEVTLNIPPLNILDDDYQLISKRVFWGEANPTLSNIIIFRFCERIASKPSIYKVDAQMAFSKLGRKVREGYGQHA